MTQTIEEMIAEFEAKGGKKTILPTVEQGSNEEELKGTFKIVSIESKNNETTIIAEHGEGGTTKEFKTAKSRVADAKAGDTCDITYTQKDKNKGFKKGTYEAKDGKSYTKLDRRPVARIVSCKVI